MRHGKSLANDAGIIVSSPEYGLNEWGLATDAAEAVRASVTMSGLGPQTLIYSSDFLRTRQTAELVSEAVGILTRPKYQLTPALRERFFGVYDMGGDENYQKVWTMDKAGAADARATVEAGVESTGSVLSRLLGLVGELEHQYKNRDILLISHGDPLNILLTAVTGLPSHRHREILPMNTAEIRVLGEDSSGAGFLR